MPNPPRPYNDRSLENVFGCCVKAAREYDVSLVWMLAIMGKESSYGTAPSTVLDGRECGIFQLRRPAVADVAQRFGWDADTLPHGVDDTQICCRAAAAYLKILKDGWSATGSYPQCRHSYYKSTQAWKDGSGALGADPTYTTDVAANLTLRNPSSPGLISVYEKFGALLANVVDPVDSIRGAIGSGTQFDWVPPDDYLKDWDENGAPDSSKGAGSNAGEPSAAYTPSFFMPIIDASDSASGYINVKAATTTTVTPSGHALQIRVSNPAYKTAYAMARSVVAFVPNGGADPLSVYQLFPELPPPAAGKGHLLLAPLPTVVHAMSKLFHAGVPPIRTMVYINMDPVSVRAALAPAVSKLPLKVLKSVWTGPGAGDRAQYEALYLDQVMTARRGVSVQEGAPLGDAALLNPADASTTTLTLFAFENAKAESLQWQLNDMPTYGDPKWIGHPLIDGIATIPVPLDLYLAFQTYDDNLKKILPIPIGTPATLDDFDLGPGDQTLQTVDSTDLGAVEFHTLCAPIAATERPNLYFSLDLTDSPEPGTIDLPWSSKDDVFASPYSGYFPDFRGNQIGRPGRPFPFQVGEGAWSDLIRFRVPPSIQTTLAAAGQSVQTIDGAFDPARDTTNDATLDGLLDAMAILFGTPISLDYYPVIVQALPAAMPQASDLLQFFRVNINDFINQRWAKFNARSQSDWESTNPLGTVVSINLILYPDLAVAVDHGCVVVADVTSQRWRFATIYDPTDLAHPLGGIREFGYEALPGGAGWVFYTRGADRPWSAIDYQQIGRRVIFYGADQLWMSMQSKLASYVNLHGGSAVIGQKFAERFEWSEVKARYDLP